MRGWNRREYFDATGLSWVSPSPNLRTFNEALLYPALGLVEATNVSVGRGTDAPFEQLGAPWIDGDAFAQSLKAAKLAGVTFEATSFVPESSVYHGETCHGVKVTLTDRDAFDPMQTGIGIAAALYAGYSATWTIDKMNRLLASPPTLDAIRQHTSTTDICRLWDADIAKFRTKRAPFLLY
jgi:uncharacterized protein YbbC (DUF1343 family)